MVAHMTTFVVVTGVLAGVMPAARAFSAPEECWPSWYDASSNSSASEQCPYGISLPGSVTWHTDMNPIERSFNVFYGYISFAIPIAAGIWALVSRGTREILFIFSIVLSVCANEYGLKNIILEPKPLGACAITCGMPSGHACTTIQYFVLLMVDYAFRLPSSSHEEMADSTRVAFPLRIFQLMSSSNVDTISLREFCALVFVWGILLVPVPFSRVMNLDHTVEQVLIGSAMGIACGLATYGVYCILGRTICRSAWQWPREKKWHVLKNTIVPTCGTQQTSSAADSKLEEGMKNVIMPRGGTGAAPTQVNDCEVEAGLDDNRVTFSQDVVDACVDHMAKNNAEFQV
jgi:hypothetical protein